MIIALVVITVIQLEIYIYILFSKGELNWSNFKSSLYLTALVDFWVSFWLLLAMSTAN